MKEKEKKIISISGPRFNGNFTYEEAIKLDPTLKDLIDSDTIWIDFLEDGLIDNPEIIER